jgi:tetratricopeptide (TPR) repeat protein
LNLFLAKIYEREEKYKNAELIYKDLLNISKRDHKIKKLLAFNLAMQSNFEESLELYENIFKNKKFDNKIIDMLVDLTYDMKKYKKCFKYVNLYLKEKPRDVEKMFMKSICLKSLNKPDDALLIYKKILQIQPYNTKAKNKIKELET